ncbi:hypothetical protein L596_026443 [Steinernema carpocapsae]|uniref:Uncharacterized protein n=1 Tax=Steinernema carpocapsae TaxID=34508 RepID=A0A4U5M1E0_STECR|nr:hypothetical protein L596_026443 [Steinernema carpocapsae]
MNPKVVVILCFLFTAAVMGQFASGRQPGYPGFDGNSGGYPVYPSYPGYNGYLQNAGPPVAPGSTQALYNNNAVASGTQGLLNKILFGVL